MSSTYLLWATGEDRPGIVAGVTAALFRKGCNLEDSSMMRLGSEFGILLIFTSRRRLSPSERKAMFAPLEKELGLTVGGKEITRAQARFQRAHGDVLSISVHGADRPGLVYRVTACLAQHKFNITDLSTHRTTTGPRPGFILFIEGELSSAPRLRLLKKSLDRLARNLRAKITLHHVTPRAL